MAGAGVSFPPLCLVFYKIKMFERYPEPAAFIYLYNLQLEIINFLYKNFRNTE